MLKLILYLKCLSMLAGKKWNRLFETLLKTFEIFSLTWIIHTRLRLSKKQEPQLIWCNNLKVKISENRKKSRIGAGFFPSVAEDNTLPLPLFFTAPSVAEDNTLSPSLIPSYLCPEKNGADILTNVVFLFQNRERVASDSFPDKSSYYIVNKALLLPSIFQRAWTKYLEIWPCSYNPA